MVYIFLIASALIALYKTYNYFGVISDPRFQSAFYLIQVTNIVLVHCFQRSIRFLMSPCR